MIESDFFRLRIFKNGNCHVWFRRDDLVRKANRLTHGDFLDLQPRPAYDRVIMNPPFDLERDIDHVMHALEFLKPDGLLVAIMSAGTEWRETRKARAFRDRMKALNASWRDLPAGSFSEVGTNVNTVILRVFRNGRSSSYWW